MKRRVGLLGGAVVAACALMVAPVSGQKFDSKDMDFMKEAVQGGMLEVKLGQYALENAGSEDVKRFARRMVDDHGKANKELLSLLGNKGVALSTNLDKKCQQQYDKLAKLKGSQFDKEYMRFMVEDHEQDVAKFQTAAKSLQDPDLKAWVIKTLPVITEHLQMAKEIRAKIEK